MRFHLQVKKVVCLYRVVMGVPLERGWVRDEFIGNCEGVYIGKTWGFLGFRRWLQLEAIDVHVFEYLQSLYENMLDWL